MTTADPTSGHIFISYRRSDASGWAMLLRDRIAARSVDGGAFLDTSSIPPGRPFPAKIEQQVATARLVIAVIGADWTGTHPDGTRRIDDGLDWIRRELLIAQTAERDVLPLFVDGASWADITPLPEDLGWLHERHALEIRPSDTDTDVDGLLRRIAPTNDGNDSGVGAVEPAPSNAAKSGIHIGEINADHSTFNIGTIRQ